MHITLKNTTHINIAKLFSIFFYSNLLYKCSIHDLNSQQIVSQQNKKQQQQQHIVKIVQSDLKKTIKKIKENQNWIIGEKIMKIWSWSECGLH